MEFPFLGEGIVPIIDYEVKNKNLIFGVRTNDKETWKGKVLLYDLEEEKLSIIKDNLEVSRGSLAVTFEKGGNEIYYGYINNEKLFVRKTSLEKKENKAVVYLKNISHLGVMRFINGNIYLSDYSRDSIFGIEDNHIKRYNDLKLKEPIEILSYNDKAIVCCRRSGLKNAFVYEIKNNYPIFPIRDKLVRIINQGISSCAVWKDTFFVSSFNYIYIIDDGEVKGEISFKVNENRMDRNMLKLFVNNNNLYVLNLLPVPKKFFIFKLS
jgi:hypothetical protein